MPRKGWVLRRKIPGDAVYGSDLVQKFISSMMYDGKRSTAQTLFKKAIENCKPVLEVKTRRVGGANYQVPVEVNPFRRQSLAIHWLVLYARTRAGKTMTDKLAEEILDAANGRGGAVKKKEDVHRMAEANKAFAHYRW